MTEPTPPPGWTPDEVLGGTFAEDKDAAGHSGAVPVEEVTDAPVT